MKKHFLSLGLVILAILGLSTTKSWSMGNNCCSIKKGVTPLRESNQFDLIHVSCDRVSISSSQSEQFFDSFPDAILVTSQSGRIVYANSQTTQLFGWTREELSSLKVEDLMPEEYRENHIQLRASYTENPIQRCMADSQIKKGLCKNQSQVSLKIALQPIRGSNFDELSCFVILRDFSKEVTATEVLEKAKVQAEQIARSISHDIRTPLQALIGLLESLKSTPLTSEQTETINELEQAMDNISNIANHHLSALSPRPFLFSIKQLGEELITIYKTNANKKKLKLKLKLDPLLPEYAFGEKNLVLRILSNLVSNAIKYTEFGEIEILAFKANDQAGRLTRFEVRDTGPGFSEDDLAHVFQKNWRRTSDIQSEVQGTGIGLMTVKELIERMHGKIGIESNFGRGTSVWIEVDLKAPDTSEIQQENPKLSSTRYGKQRLENPFQISGKSSKILIADDNPIILKTLKISLTGLGYQEIHCVSDGQQVIEELKKNDYDLIFLDNQMPYLSGIEAAQIIRKMPLENQPILIMLSGDDTLKTRQEAETAGIHIFQSKPVTSPQLEKILDSVFTKSLQDSFVQDF